MTTKQSRARERNAETPAPRQRFALDADQWIAFLAALDAPPRELPRLKRLFREPSPFNTAEVERQEDMERWQRYQLTGQAIPHAQASAWLDSIGNDQPCVADHGKKKEG